MMIRLANPDIFNIFSSNIKSGKAWTGTYWITPERKLIDPIPYGEQFRFFNKDEYRTLATCANRGRIPPKDTHLVLSQTVSTDILYVSYSCTEYGLTQCLILAKGSYNRAFLFSGFARLNPIDSYNRKKGESLAFYRALTESEALILPIEQLSSFVSDSPSLFSSHT